MIKTENGIIMENGDEEMYVTQALDSVDEDGRWVEGDAVCFSIKNEDGTIGCEFLMDKNEVLGLMKYLKSAFS